MKYLKTYEGHDKQYYADIKELHRLAKTYKAGDIVIINCPDLGVNNEAMVLSKDAIKHKEGFTVHAYRLGTTDQGLEFYDYEIVKKISPREAELYRDINKYNL